MRKKISTAEKIRRMINQGYTNKEILQKLRTTPQAVYNMRYRVNKAQGLGALAKKAKTANPATPDARTGINVTLEPPTVMGLVEATERFMAARKAEPPTPSLWERIKGWFRG